MRFSFKKLLIFLLVTRLAILVLPWLTVNLLFPDLPPQNFLEFTRVAWNHWDAPHYLFLAKNWYTATGDPANFIVFFPLFPLILKPLVSLVGNPAFSAVFISTILFIVGSYFFYKLVSIDYSEKIAFWTVSSLAIFPTSYFFNAPYTESLFLLVFVGALYAARREMWIWAGIFAGLAAATRPFGFLVFVAVAIEWYLSKNRRWREIPIIILPTLIAGLSYLYINQSIYGDPFKFQEILKLNWQKHLTSPFVGILHSWRMAFGGGLTNFSILVGWAEAVSITISWLIIPFVFKFLRKSWAIYYTLSIVLFSSTSFILSTPRYFLSIPPLFVLIGLSQKNHTFRIIWNFVSVALLFCLSILFARGQWAF